MNFKAGDVVKHKAADFKMVVSEVISNELHNHVRCGWYSETNTSSKTAGFVYVNFSEFELEKVA